MDEHTRDPGVAPPLEDPPGWHAGDSGPAEDDGGARPGDTPDTRVVGGYWEYATLRRATEHGVRLFNDGAYHESHDWCKQIRPSGGRNRSTSL